MIPWLFVSVIQPTVGFKGSPLPFWGFSASSAPTVGFKGPLPFLVGGLAIAAAQTTIHPRSGIKRLTPAMLKKMQRKAERKAREQEEEEAAIWLLLRH